MDFEQVKKKYLEYKDRLDLIEEGDEQTLRDTSIYHYDHMRLIVRELEDAGFHLFARRVN